MDGVRRRVRAARARYAWVDHAVRAQDRHSEVVGGQIAGGITYFGFLSFFPLLALALALVGYLSGVYPGARDGITSAIQDAFPGLLGSGPGQINIDDVVAAKAGAGLVGLAGLLYAGLGWVDALRVGLRRVFGTIDDRPSFLHKKVADLVILVLLGTALLCSVAVSSLATSATAYVLGTVSLDDSLVATALLKIVAVALALTVDTVLFAILLTRLPGVRRPWGQIRSGALLAAVGFEALKLLGTFLIARTTDNPVYATVGVVVGLLVWINFVSRLLIYAAAWTATDAYSLEPGGIGDPGAGRNTGLFAATDPVRAVAPADYEPVPVAPGPDAPSPGRMRTVRGAAIGAAVGAGLAGIVSRRSPRD